MPTTSGSEHLADVGINREFQVIGFDSMLTRTLMAARAKLVRIKAQIANQIHGLMKAFGLVVPAGKAVRSTQTYALGWVRARTYITASGSLAQRGECAPPELTRRLIGYASERDLVAADAYPFATAVEDPAHFRTSRSVGVWLGLTK